MKKYGIFILLICVLLSACGTRPMMSNNVDYKLTAPGEFPIVDKKIKLKVFAPTAAPNTDLSYENNEFTKWFTDKTNVEFEFVTSSYEDKNSKLSILMASKELPDILLGTDFSAEQQLIYGMQQQLLPLNDLIDKQGFYINKLFENFPTAKADITLLDGNIYSLPSMFESKHSLVCNRMYIYKPWLDKLGLEMPKTTEDFKNVLTAFKNNDPNGNNKRDEIPLAGSEKGWNTDNWIYLMNSFIPTSVPTRFSIIDNGTVNLIWGRDEYKEGLKYINSLYKAGLIAPESYTQDASQLISMGSAEPNILGSSAGGAQFDVTTFEEGKPGRWTEFSVLPPLKGPNGKQYAAYSMVEPYGKASITKSCKYPDVAFRVMESFYNEDIGTSANAGTKGKFWDVLKPTTPQKYEDGTDVEITRVNLKKNAGVIENINYSWGNITPNTGAPLEVGKYVMPQNPQLNLEFLLYSAYKQYAPFIPNENIILPFINFSADEVKILVDKNTSIENYVSEMRTDFIIEGNIDERWDAYVKQLNDIGIKQVEEIYQKALVRHRKR